MRLIIDTLIAVMLIALLTTVLMQREAGQLRVDRAQQVHQSLVRLREQAVYHGALGQVKVSKAGFPLTVSPKWFGMHGLPTNVMAPGRQPWLDIAPPGDTGAHPPDPIITGPRQAGLWYNPNLGIVRARVRQNVSSTRALANYNRLNGTSMSDFPRGGDPDRTPTPHPLQQRVASAR